MGYAELLKRRLTRDTPSYSAAPVIVNEAERMAEIVRKIGKITKYETKSYVAAAKILDLDKASEETEPAGAAEPTRRSGGAAREPRPDPRLGNPAAPRRPTTSAAAPRP